VIPAHFPYKFGKLAPIVDHRIPRMSIATMGTLPAPPPSANFYSAIPDWGMLENDDISDCVEAACLHSILQMSTYAATKTLIPTDAEAEAFYSATGWKKGDMTTDNGSYVLGSDGMLPYWHTNGIKCGGVLNKVSGFMQITRPNPVEWRQGIALFTGMLAGFQVPTSLMAATDGSVPFVWRDAKPPYEGGHEIWINGYNNYGGEWLYDLVSWGAMYRASEDFLLECMDEAVVVINPIAMNVAGLNAAGLNLEQLTADMRII
jgi:hypothetical protein